MAMRPRLCQGGGQGSSEAGVARYLLLGAQLAMVVSLGRAADGQGNPLNGSSPRPFYIFAHNPNTLEDVRIALAAGANALEPDITRADCGATDPLANLVNWDSSAPNRGGRCTDTKLSEWLDGVHELAITNRQLALVVFDVKSSAATALDGMAIRRAIRAHLNTDGVELNVIISVATKADLAVFKDILVGMGPREGVMVDEEDDALAVVKYFAERGYAGNIAFGDGTAGPGPNLFTAMDRAAWARAATGLPRAIPYVYTIGLADSMRGHIDAGVDGIIPGDVPELVSIVKERADVRVATRQDDPFQTPREAYGLKVRTGSDGTDARITFTLEGALGAASITVDTERHGRMESGGTNFVTMPSRDLGALKSITVTSDGSGNRANWALEDITVYSARWLRPDLSYHYTATLGGVVKGHSSQTVPFRVDEFVWGAFTGVSDGTASRPRRLFGDAYKEVAPGGIVHVAASRYDERMTLDKPCTFVFWGEHGADTAKVGVP